MTQRSYEGYRVTLDGQPQAMCTTLEEAISRTADTTGLSPEFLTEQWRKDRVVVDGDGREWRLVHVTSDPNDYGDADAYPEQEAFEKAMEDEHNAEAEAACFRVSLGEFIFPSYELRARDHKFGWRAIGVYYTEAAAIAQAEVFQYETGGRIEVNVLQVDETVAQHWAVIRTYKAS